MHPTEKAPLNAIWKNRALQKLHLTNAPLETGKYGTYKKWGLTIMAHLAKKFPDVIWHGLSWVIFKRKFLNLLYGSDSWSWDFTVEFLCTQVWYYYYSLVCNCRGVGSVNRGFVVLKKANVCKLWDVIFWGCHFCEVSFLIRRVLFLQHSANGCYKRNVTLVILKKQLC